MDRLGYLDGLWQRFSEYSAERGWVRVERANRLKYPYRPVSEKTTASHELINSLIKDEYFKTRYKKGDSAYTGRVPDVIESGIWNNEPVNLKEAVRHLAEIRKRVEADLEKEGILI
jgi:hypothetical protein